MQKLRAAAHDLGHGSPRGALEGAVAGEDAPARLFDDEDGLLEARERGLQQPVRGAELVLRRLGGGDLLRDRDPVHRPSLRVLGGDAADVGPDGLAVRPDVALLEPHASVCDHGGARGRKRERFVRVRELLEPAPAELLARARAARRRRG